MDWYRTINPKNYFSKLFVAQTKLGASYGQSQIMYYLAWEYGYKDDPEDPTQWEYGLGDYRISILFGIKCLGTTMA